MYLKKFAPFLVILILFFSIFYFLINSNTSGVDVVDDDTKGVEDIDYLSMIDFEYSPSLGDSDAPVVMVNYSSYYCPFCGKFKREIFPEIKEKYINTGKVKYVYKDAGSPEDRVFLAVHCASHDDRFWDYQNILINEGLSGEEDLYLYAEKFNLDMDEFTSCLEDGCCSHIVEQSQKEMEMFGVTSVPYFIINETAVSGLTSFEDFVEIIEDELRKVGK